MVPSQAEHVEERAAIRQSWGRYLDDTGRCERCRSNRTAQILFGVAVSPELRKESEAYRDLAVLEPGRQGRGWPGDPGWYR